MNQSRSGNGAAFAVCGWQKQSRRERLLSGIVAGYTCQKIISAVTMPRLTISDNALRMLACEPLQPSAAQKEGETEEKGVSVHSTSTCRTNWSIGRNQITSARGSAIR